MSNSDPQSGNGGARTFVLVPSGESDFTRGGRLQGDMDLPLTDRGRRNAAGLRERVAGEFGGLDAVYAADNQAAWETAAILAEDGGPKVRRLAGLKGVSLGLWEGQLATDVRDRHPKMYDLWHRDPVSFTPPEGEEIEVAFRRARGAAKRIRRRHRSGVLAVVAPPAVIGLLLCELDARPPQGLFEILSGLDEFAIRTDE